MDRYHRISVRVVASVLPERPGDGSESHPYRVVTDGWASRPYQPRVLVAFLLILLAALPLQAQDAVPRWRAVILDTFNTRLGSPDEVALAVSRASAMHVNTLLVQVRRRGDAFYIDANEPAPEGTTLASGFDPLAEVIARAREAGLEVHALLTLGPVWHQSTSPTDPRHVFNRHGFNGGRAIEGAENWLTRTLLPDGNGTSVDGYRFGNDFWLDIGHPAAASYLVDVVTRLVERYPVAGVHLDGLHYPEAPQGVASVGYNAVAVARFQQRTGQPGLPNADDGRWREWRREQVTALTRRVAVSAQAIRPSLVVSVSGVASGPAPGDTRATVAYLRNQQDWFAWLTDGTVDAVVPAVYRAEHVDGDAGEFAAWAAWIRDTPRIRAAVVGLGAYLNSAEGLVRQARAAVTSTGATGGVAFFSLAANNAPVVGNPLSVPAGRDTPQRTLEDMASVLRTGRTTGGQVADPVSPALFAVQVPRPALPWKDTVGHVLGQVEDAAGAAVDGVAVQLEAAGRTAGPEDVVSDGSGVFAVPAVAPGSYRLRLVTPAGSAYTSDCTIEVGARAVARITVQVDATRAAVASCR